MYAYVVLATHYFHQKLENFKYSSIVLPFFCSTFNKQACSQVCNAGSMGGNLGRLTLETRAQHWPAKIET